jgi:capsular polysaccharide biosynthesis protein
MPAADVYRSLWRHRLMIVLLTALAGVAAYAFTRTEPRIYQANALVRIQQKSSTPAEAYGALGSLELGQRLAQTYATIVGTGSMHRRVAKILDGKVPPWDISISGTPVGNVELLTISAKSEDPGVTPLVANATTVALRQFTAETGTLRDQIGVIDSAQTPSTPISPRTRFTVAFAILVALLFNCALALGRDFFADRLPEVDEWEEKFGRPVLATVPTLSLKEHSAVLSPRPELAQDDVDATSTETVAAPTRWSAGVPEMRTHGE